MPRTRRPKGGRGRSNATAILTADWHLRHDVPACRTDDYIAAQERKVRFVADLALDNECPVVVAGDLFHRWNPPLSLVAWALAALPDDMLVIPGNHDLPQHRSDLLHKSALGVLFAAGRVGILERSGTALVGAHSAFYDAYLPVGVNVIVAHALVWSGRPPFPGAEDVGGSALQVLKRNPEAQLIVTGDNHQQFDLEYKGRRLVNPGSLMRMTAVQDNHAPAVYLWYAETNELERVEIPVEQGVVSREHIKEKTEERDERMGAFIERAREDVELELSFADNLRRYCHREKVRMPVRRLIQEAMK